ncbi:MAG: YihY/virulence factor BrkB family protein [Alphaproteobacteria bacterium]|nr:YihY/virulence factor BrkB family protein [Alphaproteobacteria bacterium]
MFNLLRDLIRNVSRDHLIDRAAAIAYFQLFAIFPLLMAVVGTLFLFDLQAQLTAVTRLINDAFPPSLARLLISELEHVAGVNRVGRIIVGLGVALYAEQRAMNATIRGVNTAWATAEDRGLVGRFMGLVLTLFVLAATAVAITALTVGGWILVWVGDQAWLPESTVTLVMVLRWPVILFLAHAVINLLYRLGANTPLRMAWSTWGSLFATAAWVVVSLGFQVYLERIVDLGATYGSLGTAIGLLLYFYLLGFLVLLGAEMDALNHRRRRHSASSGSANSPAGPPPA